MMRVVEVRHHLGNLLDWLREPATRRHPVIDTIRCVHTNEHISHRAAKGVHKVTRNNIAVTEVLNENNNLVSNCFSYSERSWFDPGSKLMFPQVKVKLSPFLTTYEGVDI
jgi:hypothetical protein